MGLSEDAQDGFVCQYCGQVIDEDAPGYPRSCKDCEEIDPDGIAEEDEE